MAFDPQRGARPSSPARRHTASMCPFDRSSGWSPANPPRPESPAARSLRATIASFGILHDSATDTHEADVDRRPRRPRSQPQERRRPYPARQARGHHRSVGLRASRRWRSTRSTRRAAPLCRVAVGLRAAVSRAGREAGRRPDRRPLAGHLHRATDDRLQSPLHRRHGDGDLRLSAAAVRQRGGAALPDVRSRDLVARRGSRSWRRSRRGPRRSVSTCSPRWSADEGEFKKELAALRSKGFLKARIDGETCSLEDTVKLDRRRNHWIDVVVDRLIVRPGSTRRLTESISLALSLAEDVVVVNTHSDGDRLFSRRLACVSCGVNVPELHAAGLLLQLDARRVSGLSGPGDLGGLRPRARGGRDAVAGRRRILPWGSPQSEDGA